MVRSKIRAIRFVMIFVIFQEGKTQLFGCINLADIDNNAKTIKNEINFFYPSVYDFKAKIYIYDELLPIYIVVR